MSGRSQRHLREIQGYDSSGQTGKPPPEPPEDTSRDTETKE
jgi:hypothetical protein